MAEAARIALGTVAELLRRGGSVRTVAFVLFTREVLAAYEVALDGVAA